MAQVNLDIIINAIDKTSNTIQNVVGGMNKMQVAGAAMTAAGAAITGSMIGIMGSASEVGSALQDASRKTGVSVEQLSALKYVAEQTGVSFDTLQSSFVKMNKLSAGGVDAEASISAMNSLGVSVTDASGKFKDSGTIFNENIAALQNIKDPTEQAAAAMAIFGKGGAEMLPLIREGPAGIALLTAEAEKLGLVWTGEEAAAADAYGDSIERFKETVSGLGREIGTTVMPYITAFITKVGDVVGAVIKWAEAHPGLVKTIVIIITILGVLLSIIGPILLTFTTLAGVFTVVSGAIAAGLIPAIIAFVAAAAPVILIILAVIAVVWLLVIAVKAIVENWGPIKDFFKGLWDSIVGFFVDAWTSIVDAVKNAIGIITGIFEAYQNAVKTVFQTIWATITGVFGRLWDWFSSAGEKLWSTFITGLKKGFGAAKDALIGLLKKLRDLLPFSDAKEGPLSSLTLSGERMVETFGAGIENKDGVLQRKFAGVADIEGVNINPAAAGGIGGVGGATGNQLNVELTFKSDGTVIVSPEQIQNIAVSVVNKLATQQRLAKAI